MESKRIQAYKLLDECIKLELKYQKLAERSLARSLITERERMTRTKLRFEYISKVLNIINVRRSYRVELENSKKKFEKYKKLMFFKLLSSTISLKKEITNVREQINLKRKLVLMEELLALSFENKNIRTLKNKIDILFVMKKWQQLSKC